MDYSSRRAAFLQKHLKGSKNEILDFGCGAGTLLLKNYGKVIGVDISEKSIVLARQIYDECQLIQSIELPFESERFNYIVCIDVFGHILHEEKDNLLREFHRVLKSGGRIIFAAIETDGKDLLSKLVRRNKELYKQVFIMKHGHFGFEYPSDILKRLERLDFTILDKRKISGGLFVAPLFYIEWFNGNQYSENLAFGILLSISRFCFTIDRLIFKKRSILVWMLGLFYGILDFVFAEISLPLDYTRALAVVAEKSQIINSTPNHIGKNSNT